MRLLLEQPGGVKHVFTDALCTLVIIHICLQCIHRPMKQEFRREGDDTLTLDYNNCQINPSVFIETGGKGAGKVQLS